MKSVRRAIAATFVPCGGGVIRGVAPPATFFIVPGRGCSFDNGEMQIS